MQFRAFILIDFKDHLELLMQIKRLLTCHLYFFTFYYRKFHE